MEIPRLMFALLLGMTLVLCLLFAMEERPYRDIERQGEDGAVTTQRVFLSHGVPHPTFEGMQQGGPGEARHGRILWLGGAFAVLQILFCVAALALGMSKQGRLGVARRAMILGGIVFAGIFAAMLLSYTSYLQEDTHRLFLGFPRPTAWMVYAVWGFPLFFVACFLRNFDRWYVTQTDLDKFHKLVADKNAADEEPA